MREQYLPMQPSATSGFPSPELAGHCIMGTFRVSNRTDQTAELNDNIDKISTSIEAACESADRLTRATNRFTLALVLVALAALGFEIYKYFDDRDRNEATADFRMPTANPILEEDRPDLIGEPRIDESEGERK